ncbi:hypothetical protein B0H14DRAFT_2594550 [Mycena olivaceomarginata]|nr:hypothetical protein B0H14DRAFT_2594550 [Mycena olivaceomarginata]
MLLGQRRCGAPGNVTNVFGGSENPREPRIGRGLYPKTEGILNEYGPENWELQRGPWAMVLHYAVQIVPREYGQGLRMVIHLVTPPDEYRARENISPSWYNVERRVGPAWTQNREEEWRERGDESRKHGPSSSWLLWVFRMSSRRRNRLGLRAAALTRESPGGTNRKRRDGISYVGELERGRQKKESTGRKKNPRYGNDNLHHAHGGMCFWDDGTTAETEQKERTRRKDACPDPSRTGALRNAFLRPWGWMQGSMRTGGCNTDREAHIEIQKRGRNQVASNKPELSAMGW